MKWKKETVISKENEYTLRLNEIKHPVKKEDEYLIKAIEQGFNTNDVLKSIIIKEKKVNETIADFILAQFILDYQEFIENDNSHFEIN